jgi:uncharacterized LabA/DUF88 family protein
VAIDQNFPLEAEPFGRQPAPVKHIMILIDHENIDLARTNPKALATAALRAIPEVADGVYVTLRAYGGWFEGASPTDSRFHALRSYQDLCPTLIQTDRGLVRIAFEFADELAMTRFTAQTIDVRHTVTVRHTPDRIMACQRNRECSEVDCKIRAVHKWTRKKTACFSATCPPPFEAFFQRQQQKQVDVHLAVDLVWFASTIDQDTMIVIASDDMDILPALLQASFQNPNSRIIHLHSRSTAIAYPDSFFTRLGIIDVELGEEPQ